MAYTNEHNAVHRITSVVALGTTVNGVLGVALEKIIERALRAADANNTPISRPVSRVDSRGVIRRLDPNDTIAEGTTAANIVVNFVDGAGNAGSLTAGKYVAGTDRFTGERDPGGMPWEQEFEMEDSSLTWTPTI